MMLISPRALELIGELDALTRLHSAIDRAAAEASAAIRMQAAAHRAALSGKSYKRSLAQRVRHLKERGLCS